MSRAAHEGGASASGANEGFTLIEVLVALAVAAISLAAISSLMAANIRGSGKIAQHLALSSALRAVEAALPDRNGLGPGSLSGEMHGQNWTVDIAPFAIDFDNPRARALWAPVEIVITVQSPSGGQQQLRMVRLAKLGGAQ
ncbi:MAG: type II secretion system protein [Methylocapsa sp.]|nr:type II secretion system protein [Methylocapsa sp.]